MANAKRKDRLELIGQVENLKQQLTTHPEMNSRQLRKLNINTYTNSRRKHNRIFNL